MNDKLQRKAFLLYGTDFRNHPLHEYFDCRHNYDFTNWRKGLENIFSEVAAYNFVRDFVLHGAAAANRRILEIAEQEKPDYVLWPSMTFEVTEATLAALRRTCRVVAFFFDDLARFDEYSKYYIPCVDYIVTFDSLDSVKMYNRLGAEAVFMMNAPSIDFFKNHGKRAYRDDILFIGNNIADRGVYLGALRDAGYQPALYGGDFPGGFVDSEKMIRLINEAKINLNFTKTYDNSGSRQLKIRIFEVCMCGGFMLTEYVPGIENYFTVGEEIECFDSTEELVEKVRYYLEHETERERIAAAGYERTKRHFSYEKVFGDLFRGIEDGSIEKNNAGDNPPGFNHQINIDKADWYIRSAYGRLMIGRADQCLEELETARHYHPADKRIRALERAVRTGKTTARRVMDRYRNSLLRRGAGKVKRGLRKYVFPPAGNN